MRQRYDRYEMEIIISLGFLILFLISTNFVSGFSFQKAIKGHEQQFALTINTTANLIKEELEDDAEIWIRSRTLLSNRLKELAMITNLSYITVTDTRGNIIADFRIEPAIDNFEIFWSTKKILNGGGEIVANLKVGQPNLVRKGYKKLVIWDSIFRITGLLGALVAAAYFLRAVLYPYRRIRRDALNFNLDLSGSKESFGIEYIVSTFKNLIKELEDKRARLEIMYENSEKRADSIARYNDYILGSISSGVVICDSNGIVTRLNKSAQDILKFFENDCRGKHFKEIFGANHKLSFMLDDAIKFGKIHSRREFEIARPDGDKLWLGCSSSMINDEENNGFGAVLLMIDLTEIRRLQEISSYSEKMASLGEVAAGLAHEIRNSFAAVLGFANLIKKKGSLDNDNLKLLQSLQNESSSAETLLSRFLSLARPLEPQLEIVDLAELIKSSTENIYQLKRSEVEFDIDIENKIGKVELDPSLIKQAISNLLKNSFESVIGAGTVRLEANINRKHDENRPDELVISISDSGTGIKPENINKIFNPFFTDKPDGTGLGLTLVKKIVVAHHGRIDVRSKQGRGTRFTIYIPLTDIESKLNMNNYLNKTGTLNNSFMKTVTSR